MFETVGDSNVACNDGSCQSINVELERANKPNNGSDKTAIQALPKVDLTWANSFQFAQSLQRNFSFLDVNNDGVLNKLDLDARLSANVPQHSKLFKLAKTLDSNYTQLSTVFSSYGEEFTGLSKDTVKSLVEFASPANCENAPSFSKTVGRSVAGGAIGGSVGSKLGGGEFSEGAGKGAAVGAVVGLLAAGIESARYKEFVEKRNTIDGFGEFKNDTCAPQPQPIESGLARNEIEEEDSGFARLRENAQAVDKMVSSLMPYPTRNKGLSETELLDRFNSLKQRFSEIDTNKDNVLTYAELAEAARSKKLSAVDNMTAAIVARNIDAVSRFDQRVGDGYQIEMADLNAASRLFEKPSRFDSTARGIMIGMPTGGGAIFGCLVGAYAGMFTTAGTFSVPLCAGGAAVAGGIGGLIGWLTTPKVDPLGRAIGQERVSKLREELSWLK